MNWLARSFTKAHDKRDVEESDNLDGEEEDETVEEEGSGVSEEERIEEQTYLDQTTCKLKYPHLAPKQLSFTSRPQDRRFSTSPVLPRPL